MATSLRLFTGNSNTTANAFDDGAVYSANNITSTGTLVNETNKRGAFRLSAFGQGGNDFTMTITIDGKTLTGITFRQLDAVLSVATSITDRSGPYTFENSLTIEVTTLPASTTAGIDLLTTT